MNRILISMRVADMADPGHPSTIEGCCECGMAVWRSKSSPAVQHIKDEDEDIGLPLGWYRVPPPTPDQINQVLRELVEASARGIICVQCAIELIEPGDRIPPLTKEQIETVKRALMFVGGPKPDNAA